MNTLRHLFLALGYDDLEAALRRHACNLNAHSKPDALRTVALDGETMRGSFDHLTDRKAVHVLSAFASDAALVLAHQELAGAPDEVAAEPQLMAELGLTGVLFTAQTLRVSPPPTRCTARETSFAQAATTGNALLVRVKDSQPTLHASLAGLCATGRPFDSYETVDPAANPLGFGEDATVARSTAASRCSTPRACWTNPGRLWSAASPGCRA